VPTLHRVVCSCRSCSSLHQKHFLLSRPVHSCIECPFSETFLHACSLAFNFIIRQDAHPTLSYFAWISLVPALSGTLMMAVLVAVLPTRIVKSLASLRSLSRAIISALLSSDSSTASSIPMRIKSMLEDSTPCERFWYYWRSLSCR